MKNKIPGGYRIVTNPDELDFDAVYSYLSRDSYWAKGIPAETLKRSIEHSICFGVFHGEAQVGFARVITDRATFAYIADVFILEPHRGKGLARHMMEVIDSHEALQGLRRWMLITRDAHPLYAQHGWTSVPEEMKGRIMQRVKPYSETAE